MFRQIAYTDKFQSPFKPRTDEDSRHARLRNRGQELRRNDDKSHSPAERSTRDGARRLDTFEGGPTRSARVCNEQQRRSVHRAPQVEQQFFRRHNRLPFSYGSRPWTDERARDGRSAPAVAGSNRYNREAREEQDQWSGRQSRDDQVPFRRHNWTPGSC